MQTADAANAQRHYADQRNKELVVRRSGIVNLKRTELQRLAVWLGISVMNKPVETLKAECRAAWDRDMTFLSDRIEVHPPPARGTHARSYKSSEAYKSYQSRVPDCESKRALGSDVGGPQSSAAALAELSAVK